MSLWGRNDNLKATGLVSLSNRIVTGTGTTFGQVGAAKTGDVIRFGVRGNGGVYYGDAVIVGIASTTQLTIDSTAGLSTVSFGSTSFYLSELPKYTVLDSSYSNANSYDKQVYGISTTAYSNSSTAYRTSGSGWVGVTTYVDTHGNLRVKSEILVAMSGITTGSNGILYPTNQ